jgi:hypothetical protein
LLGLGFDQPLQIVHDVGPFEDVPAAVSRSSRSLRNTGARKEQNMGPRIVEAARAGIAPTEQKNENLDDDIPF